MDDERRKVVDFALQETELSPRELAVTFTDQERYFVSESTVYRVLKAHDLITSPAFIVVKAANEFKDKTTGINQLWQTDFTYIKVLGWGWFYLSTVLDDYTTMSGIALKSRFKKPRNWQTAPSRKTGSWWCAWQTRCSSITSWMPRHSKRC